MPHEMAPLQPPPRLADVGDNGYYHNKRFKDTAEAHGPTIGKHDRYGWTITITPETGAWLEEALVGEAIQAARLPEGGGNGKTAGRKSKHRSIKYVCPECGTSIRATREVNVVCGDCEVPFERAG